MSGIKRFLLIVFAISGLMCLAALALPWIGPVQGQATRLLANQNYFYGVQAVLAITFVGLLVTLLCACFAPRKRKTIVVEKSGGDKITVSTDAIASQASHTVESDGRFVADKVHVGTRGDNHVKVNVRVKPRLPVDVAAEGMRLHDQLEGSLANVCGNKVQRINLEFLEADPAPARGSSLETLQIPQSVYERASLMRESSDSGAGTASSYTATSEGE